MTIRLYALVERMFNEDRSMEYTYIPTIVTITETKLDNGAAVLEIGGETRADLPLDESARLSSKLPDDLGFCSIGSTLYLAGGFLTNDSKYAVWSEDIGTYTTSYMTIFSKLWCLNFPHDPAWSICSDTHCGRQCPLLVPYDGKVCIFGGVRDPQSWVEIYDPESGDLQPRKVPECISRDDPASYFLWEDRTKPAKKPMIVLYYPEPDEHLYSYDVEADSWEPLDCNFPTIPSENRPDRNLVRLGCSDYLLIIDCPVVHIYDLSSKEVMAKVQVPGLSAAREAFYAFYCGCSDEESLIYVFMEDLDLDENQLTPFDIHYAKVKLRTKGNFSATVESQGALRFGSYSQLYMFADHTSKRTAEEAALGDGDNEDKEKIKMKTVT